MKKQLSILILALSVTNSPSFASFGKVVDTDGYVNVRAGDSTHYKIIDTISSGGFVYIFEDGCQSKQSKNWYCINSDETVGYIHKSRIQPLNMFQKIPYMSFDSADGNMAYLYWNGEYSTNAVEVSIKVKAFDFNTHQSDFDIVENNGHKSATSYRNNDFWGTDGEPHINVKHYQHIHVTINGKELSVPQSDLTGLFNVDVESSKIYYNSKNNAVYITALNGEGAGSYEILFSFENGKYIGKTVGIPF